MAQPNHNRSSAGINLQGDPGQLQPLLRQMGNRESLAASLPAASSSNSNRAEATPTTEDKPSWAVELSKQMEQLDAKVSRLLEQRTIKDWYSTEEVAEIVERSEYRVREWCRLGRIRAEKQGSGRGRYQSWVISHAELQRYQKEGLLPDCKS